MRRSKASRLLALVLAFALVLSTAFTSTTSASAASKKKITKVTVKVAGKTVKSKKTVKMNVGDTKTAKVTVKPSNAKKTVSFKSSAKSVATVSKKGKITAKGAGKTTITVTVKSKNKKTFKFYVKVTGDVTPPPTTEDVTVAKSIKIVAPATTVNVGADLALKATLTPATATTAVTWSSNDTSIAVVNALGVVTGLKEGNVSITAKTANGLQDTVTLSVTAVSVTGVKLNTTAQEITEGSQTTLSATVEPANATNRKVTWTSSNPDVATVSAEGVVTAIKAGKTTITVETTDKGYKASATITVKSDSRDDVNGVTAEVTNALGGDYPTTVLVGTQAMVQFKVMKDGKAVGGEEASVQVKPVYGYTGYYKNSLDTGFVTTNPQGIGRVVITLKDGYNYGPIYSPSEAAYASFNVVISAGGATYEKTIPVTFAQVDPNTMSATDYGDDAAISVENQYDPTMNDITPNQSKMAVGEADYKTTTSLDDTSSEATAEITYTQQYVVEQQISSDKIENGDHKVKLDAAPCLIKPMELGSLSTSKFQKTVNDGQGTYSVYTGVENATTIEMVPGGLDGFNLIFDKLHLSDNTRLVIRAYRQGTDIPFIGSEGLVQKVITADTKIETTSSKKTVSVESDLFEATRETQFIDLKVFIESEGQVSDTDNVGYTLNSIEGEYINRDYKYMTADRLGDAVTWSYGESKTYTPESTLEESDVISLLGSNRNVSSHYTISVPAYPTTGNAIITEYDGSDNVQKYFMAPTYINDQKQLVPEMSTYYTFEATAQQVKELKSGYTKKEENGYTTIDSKTAGYVPVQAEVSVYGKVSYSLNSSVQWAPIPSNEFTHPKEFYALAGQTVTLKAKILDTEGNDAEASTPVTWKGVPTNVTKVSKVDDETKTDSQGYVTLVLKSAAALDISDIYPCVLDEEGAPSDAYIVKEVTVGDDKTETKHAAIHWVKPGIYYKSSVDSENEYDTSYEDDVVTVDDEDASRFLAGSSWTVGTKVVGYTTNYNVDVVAISNVKIDITSSSTDDIDVAVTEKNNGVVSLTNNALGTSKLNAKLNGFVDATKKCIITIINEDGETVNYTSVGEGEFTPGSNLIIPVNWVNNGQVLSLINNNKKFNINNDADFAPYVYAVVKDALGNPYKETTEIVYTISDSNGQALTGYDDKTETIGENGIFAIEVPRATEAGTYTIAVQIQNRPDTIMNTEIQFTDKDKAGFELSSASANDKVELVFTTEPADFRPEFFKLSDPDNTKSNIDISKVEKSSSNTSKLIITAKNNTDISSTVKCAVSSTYVEETTGVVYYFMNTDGTIYTEK